MADGSFPGEKAPRTLVWPILNVEDGGNVRMCNVSCL